MKCEVGKVCFYLIDERDSTYRLFDYVYSISDSWYRKTYIPDFNKWVYEVKEVDQFKFEKEYRFEMKVTAASQIINSLNLKEIRNIKLIGRYSQMDHSVKTENVIEAAQNL
jgi:hypothetical protein